MKDWNAASKVLLRNPGFSDVSRDAFARFLSHVNERVLSAGETLIAKGAEAAAGFFVLEGHVVFGGDGAAVAGPVLVGEEAAVGLKKYLTTLVAREPVRVLVLPREALERLARDPRFRKAMLTSLGQRYEGETPNAKVHPAASESSHLGASIGWLLAFIVPIAFIFSFRGTSVFPNEQSLYMVTILLVSIIMWVFRLLPDFVPALFAVLAIILFGVAPPNVALEGFVSTTFFMALSIFGLSTVITNSGLSYRLFLWLLRIGPTHKIWYNACLFLIGALLTPVVPTANGRISLLVPFTNDLLDSMNRADAHAEGPRLSASALGGATLLSSVFLSSKSVNFLIFGLLPVHEQDRFHWVSWFYAASVVGLVLVLLNALGTWLLFRNPSRPAISRQLVATQLRVLGPLRAAEWAAMGGLAMLVLGLMTQAIHHIDVPWVALAILFCLLMFNFLSTSAFRREIDWSFLLFLACLIGVVATMNHVGLDVWLGSQIGWLKKVMAENFPLFVVLIAGTIFLVRFALPINATVVIFATVLIPTAVSVNVNPWLVGFIILLLSEFFIWPYQASYYSQFQSAAAPEAGVSDRRLVVLNALKYPMMLIAIYASFPFWRDLGLL